MLKESLRTQVFKGMVWTLSGQTAIGTLRILSLIWLARLLSPEEFGLMTAALVVIDFSAIFVHMGIGPAIIQLPNLTPKHLSTGLIASFLLSLVIQAVVWTCAPLIALFFNSENLVPILRIVSFIFPLRGLSIVALSCLQRDLRFKEIARADVGSYLIGFGPVAIGLALLGAGAWALVVAYLVNAIVTTMAYLLIQPPRGPLTWSTTALRDLLRFGSGMTLARLAGYFGSSADNLIVGRLLGIRALGLYGRAYAITSSVVKLTTGMIDKTMFPAMAKLQNDPRRIQLGYLEAQTAVTITILPVSAFLIALAPETVGVVLGAQWMEVVPVFQVLAAGMLFRAGHRASLAVVLGAGASFRIALIQVLYGLAVVGGALIGQRWGIQGVASGVLVAMFVGYVAAGKTALDLTGSSWADYFRAHRPGLTVAAGVFSLSWLIAQVLRWISAPSPLVLFAGLAASGLISFYLARQTVLRLVGNRGIRQIRESFKKASVA